MPVVQPPAARSTIEDTGTSLVITIPSPKHWLMVGFLSFWLIGWAFGEITAGVIICSGAFALLSGGNDSSNAAPALVSGGLFLMVWFSLWTVGGAWAVYVWLWQLAGKEVVEIKGDSLTIRKQVLGWSRPKEYLAEHVRDLRVVPALSVYWGWPRGMEMWGLAGGTLAFDYGAKTFRFGAGADEAEAKQILSAIARRFPHYTRSTPIS